MGQFRLTITAVGGHGCTREVKGTKEEPSQPFKGCGRIGCVDCEFIRMVEDYKRRTHAHVESASIVHWPDTASQVVDQIEEGPTDYFMRRRIGSF